MHLDEKRNNKLLLVLFVGARSDDNGNGGCSGLKNRGQLVYTCIRVYVHPMFICCFFL